MSAVRQLGGNATTLGVKSDAPTREGEIVGRMYIASNLAVGSNVFGANALDVYGSASVSSVFIAKDQIYLNPLLNTPVAPGLAFSGDTMTGVYSPGAGTVALTAGGTERLRATSGGGVVLVGLVNAQGQVRAQSALNSAGNPGITGYGLVVSQSNVAGTEVAGEATGIAFQRSADGANIGGKLLFVSDGAGAGRGDFSVVLKTAGTVGDSGAEVLRVKNSGRVGVNTATPGYTMDIEGGAGLRVNTTGGGAAVNIQNQLEIGYASSNAAFVTSAATGDVVMRYNGGTTGKLLVQAGAAGGAGAGGPGLMVSGSNQVGVGTAIAVAGAALTVWGPSGFPKLAFANDTLTNRHIVLYQNTANNNENEFIGFGARAGELRASVDASTSAFTWVAGTGPTTTSELVRITGSGAMGIGTNAPTAGNRLHVAGAALVDTTLSVTGQVLATANGTAAAPSYSWSADTGLGLYRVGTGTLGIANGAGVGETVRVTPSNVVMGSIGVVNGLFKLGVRGNAVVGVPDTTSHSYLVLDGAEKRKFALVGSNSSTAAVLSFQMHDGVGAAEYGTWRTLMNLASNGALVIGAAAATSNVDRLQVTGVARIIGDTHAEGTVIGVANRTATTPSYSFRNSLTTGLYSPVADTVAMSTAGTERLRVASGGQVSIKNTSSLRDLNVGGTVMMGTGLPATNWHDGTLHLVTNTGLCGIGLQSSTTADTNACAISNSNESLLLTSKAGNLLFLTGSALASGGGGGVERMRVTATGVGIGTSLGISRELEVHNSARVGGRTYQKFVRTLGAVASSAVEICSISAVGGGYFAHVAIVQSENSNNSITKAYYVPVSFHCTSNLWRRITPVNSSGPSAQNEFDLDVRSSNEVTTIRVVRTSAGATVTGANITCTVIVDQSESNKVTVTDISATATGATNAGIYPYTPISLSGSRQAIGSITYRAKLNVGAEAADNAVGLEVNQDVAGQWILDLRSNGNTVFNVQGTGSVGIGKTDAVGEKLWVEGTTRLNGGVVISGQLVQNWGTVAAPAYSFSNSLGSGVYMPSQDAVALATGGVQRVMLTSGGRVGLHTATPSRELHLVGDAQLEGRLLMLGTSNVFASVTNGGTFAASNYALTVPPDLVTAANTAFTGGVVRAKNLVVKGANVEGNLQNLNAPFTNPSSVFAGSLVLEAGSYLNTQNTGSGSIQQFAGNVVLRGGIAAMGTGGSLATATPQTTNGSIVFETGVASNANRDGSNFFERARIDGLTGFLGVGLSNPAFPLHVFGNAMVASNLFANDLMLSRAIPSHAVAGAKMLVTEHSNVRASVALTENASGSIGVGTAVNASYRLDVLGDVRMQSRVDFTSNLNIQMPATATGAHQQGLLNLMDTTVGKAKIHFGDQVNTRRHLVLYQPSSYNNSETKFCGFGVSNNTVVYQADTTACDHRFFAAFSETSNIHLMAILGNGNVGIGLTTTTYKLEVAGNVKADNFVSLSDRRIKTDLAELDADEMLGALGRLKAYEYTRLDAPDARRYGLVAQEVEAALPHAVSQPDPASDLKAVSYTDLVAVLIGAVNRLQARVVQLEKLMPGL